jgi:SAM-dependent methyltransferase
MQSINICPICCGTEFYQDKLVKDFTVSHETFSITGCVKCSLKLTTPIPKLEDLVTYYLSDDYVSHSNKAASIVDKLYLIARRFTMKWKVRLVKENSPQHMSILDYGCGTGDFLKECLNNDMKISGFEPSLLAREKATQLTKSEITHEFDRLKNNYDVITLWHVLEHIPNLNEVVKALAEKLSKNGTMFIAVPNYKSADAEEYKEHWAAYDVPRHLWHFSKQSMELLLAKHNLKLSIIVPMKLDAFYVSMLSEKYLRKSNSLSGLIKAILNGITSNTKANKTGEYSSLIYIARK